MLIRLVGHFIDNPNRIDKLICINGLPDEWFFRPSRFGGKEFIKPWEADVEANIPKECRALCEPFEITESFPPIQPGKDPVVDKRMVSAVRFDYVSTAGQEAWDKIERYVERTVPRDKMVPKPVLVAPDHKSGYSPHEARRSVRGSLELRPVTEIPVIDLRTPIIETVVAPTPPPAIVTPIILPVAPPSEFGCQECKRIFTKKQALVAHVRFSHKKKEAVGV